MKKIKNNQPDEIKENNILMAEFIGFENQGSYMRQTKEVPKSLLDLLAREKSLGKMLFGSAVLFNMLAFHCSWDWLIPVVEKISRIKGAMAAQTVKAFKTHIPNNNIRDAWKVVANFINWHNEQI